MNRMLGLLLLSSTYFGEIYGYINACTPFHRKCASSVGRCVPRNGIKAPECCGINALFQCYPLMQVSVGLVKCRKLVKKVCDCGWAVCVSRPEYGLTECCPNNYDILCCATEIHARSEEEMCKKFCESIPPRTDRIAFCVTDCNVCIGECKTGNGDFAHCENKCTENESCIHNCLGVRPKIGLQNGSVGATDLPTNAMILTFLVMLVYFVFEAIFV